MYICIEILVRFLQRRADPESHLSITVTDHACTYVVKFNQFDNNIEFQPTTNITDRSKFHIFHRIKSAIFTPFCNRTENLQLQKTISLSVSIDC